MRNVGSLQHGVGREVKGTTNTNPASCFSAKRDESLQSSDQVSDAKIPALSLLTLDGFITWHHSQLT